MQTIYFDWSKPSTANNDLLAKFIGCFAFCGLCGFCRELMNCRRLMVSADDEIWTCRHATGEQIAIASHCVAKDLTIFQRTDTIHGHFARTRINSIDTGCLGLPMIDEPVRCDMGMTYFRRFRMEINLTSPLFTPPSLPHEYRLVEWSSSSVHAHAEAKYQSFCYEIDANVFPCLGERDGCLRLMREIAKRDGFLREATWLLVCDDGVDDFEYCGTVQGVKDGEFGAIQNLGITLAHRGRGLGTYLLHQALVGFRECGLKKSYLEVTAQNTGAVKLYQRLGFRRVKTVYKAADVAYA